MAVLDDGTIRAALAKLGERIKLGRDVELLIVGGAAGVLLGELPHLWTTADIDLIDCQLPQDRDTVLAAAAEVGQELGLLPSWMSEDVSLHAWTLPNDWEVRRVLIGTYGQLQVYAPSRIDLIRMKFIAHREGDLEHLGHMRVRAEELELVRSYLDSLEQRYPDEIGRIEMARQYVASWEIEP